MHVRIQCKHAPEMVRCSRRGVSAVTRQRDMPDAIDLEDGIEPRSGGARALPDFRQRAARSRHSPGSVAGSASRTDANRTYGRTSITETRAGVVTEGSRSSACSTHQSSRTSSSTCRANRRQSARAAHSGGARRLADGAFETRARHRRGHQVAGEVVNKRAGPCATAGASLWRGDRVRSGAALIDEGHEEPIVQRGLQIQVCCAAEGFANARMPCTSVFVTFTSLWLKSSRRRDYDGDRIAR